MREGEDYQLAYRVLIETAGCYWWERDLGPRVLGLVIHMPGSEGLVS